MRLSGWICAKASTKASAGGLSVTLNFFLLCPIFRRHHVEDVQLRADGGGLGFEFVQMFLGGFEGAVGQAGEFGDGDAVALLAGPGSM